MLLLAFFRCGFIVAYYTFTNNKVSLKIQYTESGRVCAHNEPIDRSVRPFPEDVELKNPACKIVQNIHVNLALIALSIPIGYI